MSLVFFVVFHFRFSVQTAWTSRKNFASHAMILIVSSTKKAISWATLTAGTSPGGLEGFHQSFHFRVFSVFRGSSFALIQLTSG